MKQVKRVAKLLFSSSLPLPGSRGYSLVELMVVVAIIGFVGLFAGPELMNFGPNMRVKAGARDLHSSLQKMKVTAAKENSNIVMRINTVTCGGGIPNATPGTGGSFDIFLDADRDGVLDAGEQQIKFTDESGDALPDYDYDMPKNSALCSSTFTMPTTPPANQVGFNSRAMRLPNNAAGVFTIKNDRGRTYTVTVSVAGSIKTEKI